MALFKRFVDSFRAPEDGKSVDLDGDDEKHLKRDLSSRHLQMIAIGGSIGTGLFVASGGSLSIGGPASVLIAYLLVGTMLFTVMNALGELAVTFPVQGAFAVYGTRFIDPAWGFAMGWNYAMQWLVTMPLELSAASIVVNYWKTGVNNGVFITIFLLLIICINLFGVKGYGEAEFLFSIVKVIAVIGFIICAIVIDVGGSPAHHYFGAKTWTTPGAFNNGFPGLCGCFVSAAFAFGGTELVGLAAAETANPAKTLPKAIKQVFWRILFFYIVSLLLIGFIVPYNNDNLLNGDSSAAASPFVIAVRLGAIKAVPSIFNAVILIAVLSVGNSSTYGSSRTIAALANIGQAPKMFGYVDRQGRPIKALVFVLLFGGLAYLGLASSGETIFNWLMSISGLSQFFTWGSICLCHIRFRQAWKKQGRRLVDIPYRSAVGPIGSAYGAFFNFLCLVAQFYVSLWPPGLHKLGTPYHFFQNYLCVIITLSFFVGYKIFYWKTAKFVRLSEIDIDSNRQAVSITDAVEEFSDEPLYKRVVDMFF